MQNTSGEEHWRSEREGWAACVRVSARFIDDLQWVALARWALFLDALSALFLCECRVTALLADTHGTLLPTHSLVRTEQVASRLRKDCKNLMRATCIWYCNQLGAVEVPVAENPLCLGDAVYKELASRAEECGACVKTNIATFNNKGTSTRNSRGAAAGELNMARSPKAN